MSLIFVVWSGGSPPIDAIFRVSPFQETFPPFHLVTPLIQLINPLHEMDHEMDQDQERSSENTTEHGWQRLWTMSFDPYNGYVQNLEDAMALLREYEIETTSRFTQTAQTAKFGSTDG